MTIRVLSRDTAEKIAAGEVIERPVSVIKELLDNAVDAGATRISIEIIAGGKEYIKISDNGSGISYEELPVAFLRHATSKLTSIEDFKTLDTLGFRGEALPSIAAISKVKFISKPKNQLAAGEIAFVGSEQVSYCETAAREGTTVIVEGLFFNTPARLKFLKTDTHEASLIGELVSEYAIGNPQIAFEFVSQGKNLLQTSGKGNLRETLAALWGKQIAASLIEQNLLQDTIEVNGYFSPFEITRSSKRNQLFFVNGRLVKNQMLHIALEEPYKGTLPYRKHPLALINISLPAEDIDVNVHPAKTLIKFHDDRKIFLAVRQAVNAALMVPNKINIDEETLPIANDLKQQDFTQKNFTQQNITQFNEYSPSESGMRYSVHQEKQLGQASFEQFQAALPYLREDKKMLTTEPEAVSKLFPRLKLLSIYKNSYIIAQSDNCLYLIDQHAAHERILYENILSKLQLQDNYSQYLLEPIIIDLPLNLSLISEEILDVMARAGFDISHFGDRSYMIRSIPNFFKNINVAETILEIMNDIAENKNLRKDAFIAQNLACKAAVKLNHFLNRTEAEQLILDLSACEEPYRCPHGRPVLVEIDDNQIQKWFKRIL